MDQAEHGAGTARGGVRRFDADLRARVAELIGDELGRRYRDAATCPRSRRAVGSRLARLRQILDESC